MRQQHKSYNLLRMREIQVSLPLRTRRARGPGVFNYTSMDNVAALNQKSELTVLVVDDTPDNLALMSSLLKDRYRVKVANHGERGLRIAGACPNFCV